MLLWLLLKRSAPLRWHTLCRQGGGLVLLLCSAMAVSAFTLKVEPLGATIYALLGEVGPRNAANHGLNNTLGFVVTAEGVVLIGSGTTATAAALIEQKIAEVSDRPIIRVINIGVQDHHWMGNSYFLERQIPVQALQITATDQRRQQDSQLGRLEREIGAEAKTITPRHASELIAKERASFEIGGVAFELIWPGGGHFHGDALLWLPEHKTLFSGDYLFHDRMLGIWPSSKVVNWQRSWQMIEQLQPERIVPGHGAPGDLAKARRDSGNYLNWLIDGVTLALEEWREMSETIDSLAEAPEFAHLQYFDSWHRRNIHQTFMQLEAAQ
ncbi:MBL fold metallo-hydrolase [Ectothiorhodospiraceae bacterium BW-2]|nr:MBL fold metallo-hydrolase [Ectothiorhodospiraceae bacterium BW-2]